MPLAKFLGAKKSVPGTGPSSSAVTYPTRTLPFSMAPQLTPEWCWAAVSASISAFYAVPPVLDQYAIASKLFGFDCGPPVPAAAVAARSLLDALQVSGHVAYPPPDCPYPLAFENVVSEIEAGHPVGCQVHWSNGSLDDHYNVIAGYADDGNQDLHIYDPYFGDHILPRAVFITNYNGGSWVASFPTVKGGSA